MGNRTILAIYQDGVFKPLEAVPLAENERVLLVIQEANPAPAAGSLFGSLPGPADLPPDDLAWAESALARSVERQLRILGGEQG